MNDKHSHEAYNKGGKSELFDNTYPVDSTFEIVFQIIACGYFIVYNARQFFTVII